MRPERPQVGPTWLKPIEKRQELLICSEVTYWVSHFDPQRCRSYRCGGPACIPCAQGHLRIVRGVVKGIDGYGRERWFEVRARHEQALEGYNTTVGLRISIRKLGPARNSPVEVKVLREEQAFRQDISRFVESLGDPAILLGPLECEAPLTVAAAADLLQGEHDEEDDAWMLNRRKPAFMDPD